MATAQSGPGKGRHYAPSTSFNNTAFYTSSPQSESHSIDLSRSSSRARDLSTPRGRVPGSSSIPAPNTLQLQALQSGRSRSTTAGARSPGAINGGLERRPSAAYGHLRKASTNTGGILQSRNGSFVNSPSASPLNTQPAGLPHTEFSALTMIHQNTTDLRPNDSPSSTLNGSFHGYSTASTLRSNKDDVDGLTTSSSQKKIDRLHSGRSRKEQNHQRSSSKQQPDHKTVGEYALHHLFNSFVRVAEHKMSLCINAGPELVVENVCGFGADPKFDQLISALGHISRQKPKPLIDTIMYWRKAKGEAANNARAMVNQNKISQTLTQSIQRRENGPAQALNTEIGQMTPNLDTHGYSVSPSLSEIAIKCECQSQLSIYLLCRVLIEVYNQTDMVSLTLNMAEKLEDIIFGQLKQTEPEHVNTSPFRYANWSIYCQLLGIMSNLNFRSVANRYTTEIRILQKDIGIKGAVTRDAETKVELMIIAMKSLRIKVHPDAACKESCDFLYVLGDFFVNSHGQPIKHAYCQALEHLLLPLAATPGPHVDTPRWKEFLGTLNSRLTPMLVKPRHWPEAFPLSVVLLCATPMEVFAAQWLPVVNSLQAKLKDRMTRGSALQAIYRLVWTYLHRVTEPNNSVVRKFEDVLRIVLPAGKKSYLSTDPVFAEPVVELIRIIGFQFPDFCLKTIIFPLINSNLFTPDANVKVEQLEPERTVLAIRSFLAVMADFEKDTKARPEFPGYHAASSSVQTREEQLSQPVNTSNLDSNMKEYYSRFCGILGRITLACDNAFGGQAVLDEKLSGPAPKTPIAETFGFGRRDDHTLAPEHKQGFYDLLHVAVQALPRCLPLHTPFDALINLLCTGTAHVQSNIAVSSEQSLKSIARQSHAQPVTIGFARYIFNFDARYSTMSDDGMLGHGHIENTLAFYVELLQIWIEEIRLKSKEAAGYCLEDGSLGSGSSVVDEVESHGVFFLCSQSRRVRSFAVKVLRLVTEFDTALGRNHPRIIQILQGDPQQVMDPNDDQLNVAERSRLQRGKPKNKQQDTLSEMCSSDNPYDSTLWFKLFPKLIRLSFELCPMAITYGRDIVCARLQQMHQSISALADNTRIPPLPGLDSNSTRMPTRLGGIPSGIIIEQWKLYLIMTCTTMTNAGAQTKHQLAEIQHTRKSSSKGTQQVHEKISSARALFAYIIPLLSAAPSSIREAIVVALGSININLYRTLLESLQYAVTTCKEEAKLRIGTHQRSGSSPRRNRRIDRLRTEVTHVYKLTSHFLHQPIVLTDEWIMNNLSTYTKDLMIFLSDAEVQRDWEFQKLRQYYCGVLEELYEGINRTDDPSRWMAFESRKSAFALMEDWCGYSANQPQVNQREDGMKRVALTHHQDAGEKTSATATIEIEKRDLRNAALSAMAALCGGPISVATEKGDRLSFDVRRMLSWIDQIFGTVNDKYHVIGRRALHNLMVYNRDFPYLMEKSLESCYKLDRPKALESYFEVITKVLMEHNDYPLAFWRILSAVLFTLGNEKAQIRMKSALLLRTLEQRQQKSSKLQDFDISVSDRTTAVYKLAQFEISKRLCNQHSELAFFIFSQFSIHFKDIHPDSQRNMVAAILPWIQSIELKLDPSRGPTLQSYMLLANLLEITTKSSSTLHNEIQALWQAIATGPHGGNVQVVLDFVISLCLDRREQSFVDYAKQIVVYLSSTPAGQKVVEFLLLQITPKNMVQEKREPIAIPPESHGLPYIADLSEALPIGNRQSGFSLGQLSLILLVDLIVAPAELDKESVPLLLQVVIVLWDHYTLVVQEQAREMLVHLIHELVITKKEFTELTVPSKATVEELVESIRQHKPHVVWNYEEISDKDEDDGDNRVPKSMAHLANEVVSLFTLVNPKFHEQWARTTLSWATSCPVRHVACRSFQIFRCILNSLDLPMLADMLARLSNTIADEEVDIQTFSMEILTTLRAIIAALEPADILKYPQLFWATCACLDTIHEREFIESLGMLDKLLDKVNFNDPAVIKLLESAKPERWEGDFEGVAPLVYKGLKSATSLERSLKILDKLIVLPDSDLIGNKSRLLFGILAYLPRFLHFHEIGSIPAACVESARILASTAESFELDDIAIVLISFANLRYESGAEFLFHILTTIRQYFFPVWELKSLIFLMGLLTNRLPWFKSKTMEILCRVIPDVDMRGSEAATYGPDLISPLLRLLQTEYCPQALKVMDCILIMSTTPMERLHLRMSMANAGSRSIRKEYERTQSLYGIPEETGWSIPMPAIHSKTTRDNVHAVFYTCATTNTTTVEETSTPEIGFDCEEYSNGSYFPDERTNTMTSEDPREYLTGNRLDILIAELDELNDFFEKYEAGNGSKTLSGYSDFTVTGYPIDNSADLYDQQTAPILHKSLARTASVTSLHHTFPESRNPPTMTPVDFQPLPTPTIPSTRPTLHNRSITSPANNLPRTRHISDSETDNEIFSDDERSSGQTNTNPSYLNTLRTDSAASMRRIPPGAAGRDYRQKDLLRAQSRGKSQIPGSPDVPKLPEAYLAQKTGRVGDI